MQRLIVDSHIHLCHHYSGGLRNRWVSDNSNSNFRRDWTERDYLSSAEKSGRYKITAAVFVECFNYPNYEEANWVLRMIDDDKSVVSALIANIEVQKGAAAVNEFLDRFRSPPTLEFPKRLLPKGLKGARCVFMVTDNNSPTACLEQPFLDGLAVLNGTGLIWEFCCHANMVPHLFACCSQFPDMIFVIDHLAHNASGDKTIDANFDEWSQAIVKLSQLPNVYCKMGAIEEWGVSDPANYLDHAIKCFGFQRVLYESNWFVSEAMGNEYDSTATQLEEALYRQGASEGDVNAVFNDNAKRVYTLDLDV